MWTGITIIGYTYLAYPTLLWILSLLKTKSKKDSTKQDDLPTVALIVCAYNEEDYILEKLKNSLELNYPSHLMQLYFVLDGSDDSSVDVLKEFNTPEGPDLNILFDPIRSGKVGAMNHAMKNVTQDIAIFTDANSILNPLAIQNLINHFNEPSIGMVAGEKRIKQGNDIKASQGGEGLYWRYESTLKNLESRVYSTIGAAGELFAIRSSLYKTLPDDLIIEDFYLSMKVALQGYKVAYESNAIAYEYGSLNISEERKRKVRIASGAFQVLGRLPGLLNFWSHPVLSWQYFSHRVLRWAVVPLLLPVIFVLSGIMAYEKDGMYTYLFLIQLVFYGMAILGMVFRNNKSQITLFYVPFYMVFMNTCMIEGLIRHLRNDHTVNWEKSRRASSS